MIDEKFLEKSRKVIERRIAELDKEISVYKKYSELGTSDTENVLEFETFEENLAFMKNAEKELSDLRQALVRVDKGKYGKCEVCGQEIETGRLSAYPAASTCVTHAK